MVPFLFMGPRDTDAALVDCHEFSGVLPGEFCPQQQSSRLIMVVCGGVFNAEFPLVGLGYVKGNNTLGTANDRDGQLKAHVPCKIANCILISWGCIQQRLVSIVIQSTWCVEDKPGIAK